MSQKDVWNKLSIQWARFRHTPQEAVEPFLSGKKGLILDAGCGAGRNITAGRRCVAFDFASDMIYLAQKKHVFRDEVDFAVADCAKMPFASGKFDSAIAVAVLHSMHPAEQEAMLSELFRVMKPGAELLVTVWNRRQPRFAAKKKESFIDWRFGDGTLKRYYYLFTKSELEALLRRHGFSILSIRGSSKKDMGVFSTDIIATARKGS